VIDIAEKLNDKEILSILGYSIPGDFSESSLPPVLKASLDNARDEIEREYKTQGITDFSSPEALRIAKEILEDHGWTVTI
jgi:Glu-tRNA(Gln) amidotransferase subunit E-like FAD-binding protein